MLSYLKDFSSVADAFLKKFFAKKKKDAGEIDLELTRTLEIFENYVSGGKKIRGALTVLGYQMAGGRDSRAILPVSLGVELLHNFLLIHDDVIDKDVLRRGKPTVHRQVGESKAIIIGDIGAFLAQELIILSAFPGDQIVAAQKKLNELVLKTMYGEMLDVDYDTRKGIGWEDIFRVRLFKTAYYTFVMPLSVGATLAEVNAPCLAAIEAYGASVGIAFQIADDILGVFGDPKVTGKSSDSDIREGKKTFLYAKALELSKGQDKIFLRKRYGAEDLKPEEIQRIKKVFEDSGSLDYSKKLAASLAAKGSREIKKMTDSAIYRQILAELADFVVTRNK